MTPLVAVRNFVLQLLQLDPSQVILGRMGYDIQDFSADLIVVDAIAITALGYSDSVDLVSEISTFATLERYSCTLDIYGSNCYMLASRFRNLLRSQQAKEIQEFLKISIKHVTSMQDLKELAGTEYSDRVQVLFNTDIISSGTISTLRIDSADDITFLYED